MWELWAPLTSGARVVVLGADEVRDPAAVHRILREENVTVLNQTPAAFKGLRAHLEDTGAGFADLPLRTVIFGGDAFDVRDYRDWFTTPGHRPALVNMYGITETTVHVTIRTITEQDIDAGVRSPIGRPLAGQHGYVLDSFGRLVPPGSTGELYVSGGGVARGYLNRPGLTAARFPADPFGPPGTRMYRTGDLVRRDARGELHYLGRTDHQLKLRGHRIEAGEVEQTLARHPAVLDAVVSVREDEPGLPRLVAHLLAAPGCEPPTPADLRASAARTLPGHMVPSAYVVLDRFPLTENGKTDRAALPAPEPGTEETPGRVALRTPTEEALAAIWEETLHTAVGAEDDYFALGGDSLRALLIASRANDAFGVALTPRDVLVTRTVAGLADLVEEQVLSELEDALRGDSDHDEER
ncbi:non-ribosomal peptide synthetase [Streptomyces sp. NPDC005568]|uniref:non-ribosomal peptide synthetase n=1 Tax=Streptomyces sp. NPDC005568 TaxID=3156887 RepID=UPI0033B7EC6A